MTKEFIKINDSDYVLADDSGNIRIVKINDDSVIEEIVAKENELEYYQNLLNKYENKIKLFIFNNKLKKYIQVPGSVIMTVIFFYLTNVDAFLLWEKIAFVVGINAFCNLFLNSLAGSFRGNKKKLKSYISSKQDVEEKIDTLTTELSRIKSDTEYREYEEEVEEKVSDDVIVGRNVGLVESFIDKNVFIEPAYTFKKKVRVLKKD